MEVIQLSLFGKMFPERSVQTAEKTSAPCWKNLPAWKNRTLQFLDLRGGGRWSKAGAIAGNGWSLAWRQLDAQYWGVPQRRKRIALVVDFAGGRAGKILFERESLPGHPDQSIPTWQEAARTAGNRPAGNDRMVGQQGGASLHLENPVRLCRGRQRCTGADRKNRNTFDATGSDPFSAGLLPGRKHY